MSRKFVDLNDLAMNTPAPAVDLSQVNSQNPFLNQADMQRPSGVKNKGGRKPVKDKANLKKEVYFTKTQEEQIRMYCEENFTDFSRLVKSLLVKEGILHVPNS